MLNLEQAEDSSFEIYKKDCESEQTNVLKTATRHLVIIRLLEF